MSKSSRRRSKRKKKKQFKYSKKQFINNVCSQCRLCKKNAEPNFCYYVVYKENPKKFINMILVNLIEVRRWLASTGVSDTTRCLDEDIEYIFNMGFCSSNFCGERRETGNTCAYIAGCLSAFRLQVKGLKNSLTQFNTYPTKKGKRNKRKNNKHKAKTKRHTPKPQPSFFCNEGMMDEVKEIINGTGLKQQNKSEEAS